MSRDVSIVFRSYDRLSGSIRDMRNGVNGLSRDIMEYRKIQDRAFREKAKISLDITQAKQNLKELEKAVKQGTEGAREAFEEKRLELERLNEEYRRMGEVAKEAAKAERQLAQDISRTNNANATRNPSADMAANARSGSMANSMMMMRGFATAGLGQMVGGAMQNYLYASIGSMYGQTVGSAVSSVGGGIISGGAIGSMFGPVGASLGAAIGGLTGAINAMTDKQNKEDDIFRNEVQSLHTTAIQEFEERKQNGIALSANREMALRNYQSMAGQEAGTKLYDDMVKYGDTTPYDTTKMLGEGKQMLVYGVDKSRITDLTKMIGDIAMGDQDKFSGLAYAIAQSLGAGTLNGQDARQMINWGFNPYDAIAEMTGKSTNEVKKMGSDGELTSDMLIAALKYSTSEGGRFYNGINAMSDTYISMVGQLESAKNNIDIAMGDAYREKRQEGIAKELEAYNGETGNIMKEAYELAGKYEAELENQRQQSMINAIQKVYESAEYKEAIANGDGIEAERLMWEAKTNAEIEYKNGPEYQKKLAAEQGLVGSIQADLLQSGDYLNFGIAMGEEFSKGYSGAVHDGIKSGMDKATQDIVIEKHGNWFQKAINTFNNTRNRSENNPYYDRYNNEDKKTLTSHADGIARVPFDNYPAMLHEGERVLTRAEVNQQQKGGGSVTIAKIADSVVIREDADIEKIARAFAQKLQQASLTYGGEWA